MNIKLQKKKQRNLYEYCRRFETINVVNFPANVCTSHAKWNTNITFFLTMKFSKIHVTDSYDECSNTTINLILLYTVDRANCILYHRGLFCCKMNTITISLFHIQQQQIDDGECFLMYNNATIYEKTSIAPNVGIFGKKNRPLPRLPRTTSIFKIGKLPNVFLVDSIWLKLRKPRPLVFQFFKISGI